MFSPVGQANALPSGPFELGHRSRQFGLRAWVEQLTGRQLGYIEQLYTFADRDRVGERRQQRVISINYLALTRAEHSASATALRDRNRVLLFGYIKRNKCFAILSHGSPSVREDRLGPSEQPRLLIARKGGPPISASEHDV